LVSIFLQNAIAEKITHIQVVVLEGSTINNVVDLIQILQLK